MSMLPSTIPEPIEGEFLPRNGDISHPSYEQLRSLEALVPKVLPTIDIDSLTNHEWCDGVYCRKFFLPAGAIVVGKMHKQENFFLLVQGEVSILTEGGVVRRIKAPYLTVTKPGLKRVVYAYRDALMLTFHGNPENSHDLKEMEERYIIPEAKPTLPSADVKVLLEKLI